MSVFPTAAGPAYARTVPAGASLERRARRLLSLRLSRADHELETVLQTEQRQLTPFVELMEPALLAEAKEGVAAQAMHRTSLRALIAEEEEEGSRGAPLPLPLKPFDPVEAALTLTLAEGAGSSLFFEEAPSYFFAGRGSTTSSGAADPKGVTPLFARLYSTQVRQAARSLSRYIRGQLLLHRKRGRRRRRWRHFPPRISLTFRYRLKGRLLARGRTEFAAWSRTSADVGGVDPRALRARSPRNQSYIIRLLRPLRQLT